MAGQAIGRLCDQFRGDRRLVDQHPDGAIDPRGGMPHQQLQHADVVPRAGAWAKVILERVSQPPERLGQLPVADRRHMIQPRRLAFERHDKVQRVDE